MSYYCNVPTALVRCNDFGHVRPYMFDSPKRARSAFNNLPNTSATERFLNTDDLLRQVFEYFQPESGRSGQLSLRERAELRGFMLTTKFFFHHAAAILWGSSTTTRDLYRLLNIMDIAPLSGAAGGARAIERYPPASHSQYNDSKDLTLNHRINGAVSKAMRADSSWNHFLYYGSLIRVLHLQAATFPKGVIPILTQLIADKSPILPSLSELHWDEEGVCENDLLFLVGSNLRVLTIGVPDIQCDGLGEVIFSAWAERLCKKLSCLCPDLRTLSIHSHGGILHQETILAYFNHLHRLPVHVFDSVGG